MLAYCVCRDILGNDFYDYQGCHDEVNENIPLPLEEKGKDFKYWAASNGLWCGIETLSSWKKRFDTKYDDYIDFAKKQAKIRYKMGHFKAYDMPIVLHSALYIRFYVVGNKQEIERLLNCYLCGVGKKISQGWGWIKNIEVKQINNDYSCFYNGVVMRAIPDVPSELKEGMRIEYTGYRPPYWLPGNQKMCLVA